MKNKNDIENVKITPWNLDGADQDEVVVIPAVSEPNLAKPPKGVPRGVKIGQAELKQFGYTKGCPKCEKMRRGDKTTPTLGHSEACRARIVEEMKSGTQAQQQRVLRGRILHRDFEAPGRRHGRQLTSTLALLQEVVLHPHALHAAVCMPPWRARVSAWVESQARLC